MRKRDELTDPNSCMSRARDDEWTFVLLGRDEAATVAVRAWINERLRLGKNTEDDPQIIEAELWIERVVHERQERLDRANGGPSLTTSTNASNSRATCVTRPARAARQSWPLVSTTGRCT